MPDPLSRRTLITALAMSVAGLGVSATALAKRRGFQVPAADMPPEKAADLGPQMQGAPDLRGVWLRNFRYPLPQEPQVIAVTYLDGTEAEYPCTDAMRKLFGRCLGAEGIA